MNSAIILSGILNKPAVSGVALDARAATEAPLPPAAEPAAGVSTLFARQDHVHPSRVSLTAPTTPVDGDVWMV